MNESNHWQLFDELAPDQVGRRLDFLATHFRRGKEYHRLFDVLKMQLRQKLGLPLLHSEQAPAPSEEVQQDLEDGLLESCREMAKLHFSDGLLEDGWVYLQPIGDEPLARELIEGVEVTDENFNTIVEIAFNQGIHPEYGYEVMLRESGTCNGITAFDVHARNFDSKTVSKLASVLLNHFYDELLANVRHHVKEMKGEKTETKTLAELLLKHDWLVNEGGHHIDATHLASVVRISRQCMNQGDHEKALALSLYGCRLGDDFKFGSDPPFQDIYEDHRLWFAALSGKGTKQAVETFSRKANEAKGEYGELACAEALVDLQIRIGDRDAAVASAVQRLWPLIDQDGLPPSAFEIAKSAEQFNVIAEAFKQKSNFAGYAFAKICAATA